jgi:hypothetical protein
MIRAVNAVAAAVQEILWGALCLHRFSAVITEPDGALRR